MCQNMSSDDSRYPSIPQHKMQSDEDVAARSNVATTVKDTLEKAQRDYNEIFRGEGPSRDR